MLMPTAIISAGMLAVSCDAGGRPVAVRQQVHSFEQALKSFRPDTGTYPTVEQGLRALLVRPVNVERGDGPYKNRQVSGRTWPSGRT